MAVIVMAAALLLAGCSSNTAAEVKETDTPQEKETAAVQVPLDEEETAAGVAVESVASQSGKEIVQVQFYNNCEGKDFTELYVSYFSSEDGKEIITDNLLTSPAAEESKGNMDTYVLDYQSYSPIFEVEAAGKTDVQISAVMSDGEKITFESSANGCYVDPAAAPNLITLQDADGTPVAETMNE